MGSLPSPSHVIQPIGICHVPLSPKSMGSDQPSSTTPSHGGRLPLTSISQTRERRPRRGRRRGQGREEEAAAMHSFGYRANALVTFAVTILAVMCSLASLSDNFNIPTPSADVKVSTSPTPSLDSGQESLKNKKKYPRLLKPYKFVLLFISKDDSSWCRCGFEDDIFKKD